MRQRDQSWGSMRMFCEQNFISQSTVREISSLRQDFIGALSEIGFIPFKSKPADDVVNANGENENLIKAVILGGLWPRIARVGLSPEAFKPGKSGGAARKPGKTHDLKGEQVFLHPGSVLFRNPSQWNSPYITYFGKLKTSKVFLHDATEVPLYAILLFGGPMAVNHVRGGLTVACKNGSLVKLRAQPQIRVLVNQLRLLLDAQLQNSIEDGSMLTEESSNPVLSSILALLEFDGFNC